MKNFKLALILVISNSLLAQTADVNRKLPFLDTTSGYIRSVEDIAYGKVEYVHITSISTPSSIIDVEQIKNGKTIKKKINLSEIEPPIWGFALWGEYYRLLTQFPGKDTTEDQTYKKKVYMMVCKVGPICLYGPIRTGGFKTTEEGDTIPTFTYDRFLPAIYISKDLDGKTFFGDFNMLKKLVGDDADLVQIIDDLKLTPSQLNDFPSTEETFSIFMFIIEEYNRRKTEE